MATKRYRVLLAKGIATFASLSFACYSSIAQATPLALSDRDAPTVEIYPRYPVSPTFSPGRSLYANDFSRAPVLVTIYSHGCPLLPRLDAQIAKIKTSIVGNRFDVSGVTFNFSDPLCFNLPEGPVFYSVFLGDLGPGTYQAVVSGLPGDVPISQYPAMPITTMTREFVVLDLDQAGKAVIENPAPDSVQSGVGLISGWACVADRVEISLDGGARLKVPGEMGRADVQPVCGHGTAGFGLLTNFNLLAAGTHTVQLYVKGVALGTPTRFSVVVPVGEFLSGVSREVSVSDFPSPDKSVTLDWREAEQNFRVKAVH